MNPLEVDPATGFLQSSSPNLQTFDAEKKTMFIQLALEEARAGKWPDVNKLCEQFGITVRTFQGHREKDVEFRAQWEEVKRLVANEIAGEMREFSKRPSNYMDRVTLLRHLYPEEWGGQERQQSFHDVSWIKNALTSAKTFIDAEIVTENKQLPSENK